MALMEKKDSVFLFRLKHVFCVSPDLIVLVQTKAFPVFWYRIHAHTFSEEAKIGKMICFDVLNMYGQDLCILNPL